MGCQAASGEQVAHEGDQRVGGGLPVAGVAVDDGGVGEQVEGLAHLRLRVHRALLEAVDGDGVLEAVPFDEVDDGKVSSSRAGSTRSSAPSAPRALSSTAA